METEILHNQIKTDLEHLNKNKKQCDEEITRARKNFSGEPEEILTQERAFQQEIKDLIETGTTLKNKCNHGVYSSL